ncbi:hypothetical protein KJ756_02785 [Patescibacteria group bacterium]|nr:hypothetical protein [Patescibacteria group bacterium]MBU4082387.1 hypothetical protein [Patescibacteria group bacterium]
MENINMDNAYNYYANMGVYTYIHSCGSGDLKFLGLSGEHNENVDFFCNECKRNFSVECKGGYLKSKGQILTMLYP